MRIAVKTELGECTTELEEKVSHRLRCALGSHASDVQHVSVSLCASDRAIVCRMRLRLRGRRELEISSEASSVDEVLRFSARRAGAAVARRVDTDRILRS